MKTILLFALLTVGSFAAEAPTEPVPPKAQGIDLLNSDQVRDGRGNTIAVSSSVALLLPEHPTSRELAVAANHYIALGEERTVQELKAACEKARKPYGVDLSLSEQIGWLCQLLYSPRPGQPLRAPGFGALGLPFNTMPSADWPLYPLTESAGVFFILAESYTVAGVPEDAVLYLDYCAQSGSFRRETLHVPTPDEAERALSALLASKAWKQIKWRDSGSWFSYEFQEADRIAYLQKQTHPKETSPPPAAETPSFTESAAKILGPSKPPAIQEFR